MAWKRKGSRFAAFVESRHAYVRATQGVNKTEWDMYNAKKRKKTNKKKKKECVHLTNFMNIRTSSRALGERSPSDAQQQKADNNKEAR